MFRQSRLASMGEMIGNIAHQWRQPLNAMVLVIQSFQMKRLAGVELSDTFIETQTNEGIALASMMSRTIDDFRNFFKPNRGEEEFALKEALGYSIQLVKEYYTKADIEISLVCPWDVHIQGYPNEFSQVLMNLFSNAKDAMEERKIVEKQIEVLVEKGENSVEVKVIDNGGGIEESVRTRMFDPYFTTKHKSSGTGIGLYMSQQIIEKQMRGTIRANNGAHRFSNGSYYEHCAMIIMVLPLGKKEEKKDGF